MASEGAASATAVGAAEQGRLSWREWRVIILASLGGALEYYDFVVYGIFAKYIASAFFPSNDPLVSLMLSFAVFAVGYIARPLGGVVLAHFGDKYGRRRVFIASILLMSASTFGMGLLPTAATWGIAATMLMILLRLTQGFCLGGELPGAITYVVETAPKRAGLACGVIFVCVNSGVMLAALFSLIVHETMTPEEVGAWGWRIAFLIGGALGLISFWLRLSLEESPEFEAMRHTAAKQPLGELVRSHPGPIFVGIAIVASMAGFNGLLFAHLPAYLTTVLKYDSVEAMTAQNVCLAVISVGNLFWAWLGDKIPRRYLLMAGSALVALLAAPFYHAAADRTVGLIPLVVIAGIVGSLFLGTFAAILADLYPTRIRFSGVAVSMNLGVTIFSGAAPLAATWLISATGSPAGPGYFMTVAALIGLGGSLFLKRYDGQIRVRDGD